MENVEKRITNRINAISHTYNDLLITKLKQLENDKQEFQSKIISEEKESLEIKVSTEQLAQAFKKAVCILKNKKTEFEDKKTILSLFINKILIEKDSVNIFFNTIPTSQSRNLSLDITDECHIWYKKKSYGKVPQENILGWGGRICLCERSEYISFD